MQTTIRGLTFVQTCGACPEQYDIYDGETPVGYLRLRGGHLYVECPDAGGQRVLERKYQDGLCGCLEFDDREKYLSLAAAAVAKWMRRRESCSANTSGS